MNNSNPSLFGRSRKRTFSEMNGNSGQNNPNKRQRLYNNIFIKNKLDELYINLRMISDVSQDDTAQVVIFLNNHLSPTKKENFEEIIEIYIEEYIRENYPDEEISLPSLEFEEHSQSGDYDGSVYTIYFCRILEHENNEYLYDTDQREPFIEEENNIAKKFLEKFRNDIDQIKEVNNVKEINNDTKNSYSFCSIL